MTKSVSCARACPCLETLDNFIIQTFRSLDNCRMSPACSGRLVYMFKILDAFMTIQRTEARTVGQVPVFHVVESLSNGTSPAPLDEELRTCLNFTLCG